VLDDQAHFITSRKVCQEPIRADSGAKLEVQYVKVLCDGNVTLFAPKCHPFHDEKKSPGAYYVDTEMSPFSR
jgi:hypothetical protein